MKSWLISLGERPLGVGGALLEILILTAMLYGLFQFIRGTRGASIARGATVFGVILFLLLLFTAQAGGLENVRWIMENLVGVSLIAVFVIFQPEIRRGFIRLGERAWSFYSGKGTSIEKEVTQAAVSIAKTHEVGALIVIEREPKIGAYIESGVVLDAVVDAKLLRTIFSKNSPLHDGAVIIREGRIAAANCLLPLSENIEVCRGMGTRHRAAIGLSEESDAIVVVVSEETGEISVAMGGQIQRGFDYERLLDLLHRECTMIKSSSRRD